MPASESIHVHDLTVGEPPPDAPTVILIHGITANGLSWGVVAAELARRHGPGTIRLLAPDLRGRGASPGTGAARGLAGHVADLRDLAADLPGKPLLVGHSMGAFVAALAVAEDPAVYAGAVLVDGGLAIPPPPELDIDATLTAVIGPAMTRLSMRFADEQAYLDFWRQHPALGPSVDGPQAEQVRAYLRHDLVPAEDGGLRSSCEVAEIRADGADVLTDQATLSAVRRAAAAGVPLEFVWAERGLQDEPTGLYDEQRLAALAVPEQVRVSHAADTNHYTVILGEQGVGVVADAVDRLLR